MPVAAPRPSDRGGCTRRRESYPALHRPLAHDPTRPRHVRCRIDRRVVRDARGVTSRAGLPARDDRRCRHPRRCRIDAANADVNYPIEQYVRGVGCLGPARASARETSADVVISLRQSEYLFTDPPEGCHLIDRSANATVRLRSAIGGRRVRGVALARGGFTSFSPLMHSFVGLAPHDAKLMLEPAARVSVRHTGRQTGPLPTVVDQRPRPNRRLTNRRMNRNVLLVVSP